MESERAGDTVIREQHGCTFAEELIVEINQAMRESEISEAVWQALHANREVSMRAGDVLSVPAEATVTAPVLLGGDHPWKGHTADLVEVLENGCWVVSLRTGIPGREVYAWPDQRAEVR